MCQNINSTSQSSEQQKQIQYGQKFRKTISSINYFQNNTYGIFYYLKNEGEYLLLFFIFMVLACNVISLVMNHQCQLQIDNTRDYCHNKYDFIKIFTIRLLASDLTFFLLCYEFCCGNFERCLIDKIYWVIVFLIYMSTYIWTGSNQQIQYNFLWIGYLIFLLYKKMSLRLKWLDLLERTKHSMIFMIVNNIFLEIVVKNPYDMNIFVKTFLQNLFLALVKNLIVYSFLLKLQLKVECFDDIKWQIHYLFSIEMSLNLNVLMKCDYDFKSFLFFFNQVVMFVFNLTQFHFIFYLCKIVVKRLLKMIFQDKCLNIQFFLVKLVEKFWMNYGQFLAKISQRQENLITLTPQYTESDILRVIAAQYILSNALFYIYILLLLTFRRHIPYQFFYLMKVYEKFNLKNDGSVHDEVYHFDLIKVVLHFILFTITLIIVYYYAVHQNIKFFGMRNIASGKTQDFILAAYLINNYGFFIFR